MMRPPALFALATRRAGPDLPLTSYLDFIEWLRRFSRDSAVPGLVSLAWLGWTRRLATPQVNELARGYADRIAGIAAAVCEGGEPFNVAQHGGEVLARFLAIKDTFSIPGCVDGLAQELFDAAQASSASGVAALFPKLETARAAVPIFSLGRIVRSQWASQHAQLDDLVRMWWIAKRLDERAGSGPATARLLGLETHLFFRAAFMLLSLAMSDWPPGRINTHRGMDTTVRDRFHIDHTMLDGVNYFHPTTSITSPHPPWLRVEAQG